MIAGFVIPEDQTTLSPSPWPAPAEPVVSLLQPESAVSVEGGAGESIAADDAEPHAATGVSPTNAEPADRHCRRAQVAESCAPTPCGDWSVSRSESPVKNLLLEPTVA